MLLVVVAVVAVVSVAAVVPAVGTSVLVVRFAMLQSRKTIPFLFGVFLGTQIGR